MNSQRALAPVLVGRDEQLRELEAHVESMRHGAGRLVLLAGDAGVGKTRLLCEFTRRMQSADLTILKGHCYEDDPAPYAPFVDAMRACIRERGVETILQTVGPMAADLVKLLPELESQIQPYNGDSEPQLQKRRLFDAIYRFIRGQNQPTNRVLILEDLHWSDQTSQELLRYLARTIEHDRVLVIGTYRTDELHRRHPLTHLIAQLARERLYHEIRLAPLPREEIAQLLELTLKRPLPTTFVDALYDRTEGNPFFTEEILKALIEDDRLEAFVQAVQQGRHLNQLALPISISDSILRRTADLDEVTTEVLSYAAVIGRQFDFELLLDVTGYSEAELVRALTLLSERQLIVEQPHCEDCYSFRHELAREAIYSDLLGRERRMKHRDVLRALEEYRPDCQEEIVDQLAYHSVQARELEKAVCYAQRAGDRAAGVGAYREALLHYETALESLEADNLQGRAALLAKLGDATYLLGDIHRCTRAYREAQQLYERIGDRRMVANMTRLLGRSAWARGDRKEAFALISAALEMLEREPPGRDLAMAYSALSQLYMASGQPHESIPWGEKALALAEQFGDETVRTHALNNIGSSLVEIGETGRGLAYLEESLALAKRNGLVYDTLRAYTNLGYDLAHLGYFTRSAAVLAEGLAFTEQIGWDLYPGSLLTKSGQVEMMLGNWRRAEELLDQAHRASQVGLSPLRCYASLNRAELLIAQGRLREAQQVLEVAAVEYEGQEEFAHVALLQARIHLWQRDVDQALKLLDSSIECGLATHLIFDGTDLLHYGVEIYLRAGKPDQAQKLLETLTPTAEQAASLLRRALLEHARGLVAAHEQRHDAALEHFQHAIALWQEMRVPLEEAVARRRRAECLLQRGGPSVREEARAELAAARAILERLGAALELDAVEALTRRYGLERRSRRTVRERAAGLTPREQEVIRYIAHGYSNRAIAEALLISEKTAEVHVGNILGKLGFTSRSQAAAYAVEQGLVDAPVASQELQP